jgi:hypothetical protein
MRRLILAFLRHYAPAEEAAASGTAASATQPPPPPPPFEPTCQVVVLGAGYDTTWLQLCREHDAFVAGTPTSATTTTATAAAAAAPDPGAGGGVRPGRNHADPRARVRWVEVDFPEVVASKARVLLSGRSGGRQQQQQQQTQPPPQAAAAAAAPSLLFPPRPSHATATTTAAAAEQAAALVRAQLSNTSPSSRPPPEILGRAYASVGCDLRSPPERGLGPALARAGAAVAAAAPSDGGGDPASFSLRLPTLFVAECVLAYLEPGEARALLEFLGRCAAATGGGGDGNGNSTTNPGSGVPAAVLAYDVVSPDDPFGRQMQANLAARGCPMRGAAAAPDPAAQAARLRAALSLQPSSPEVSVEADALDMSDAWSRTLAVDLEAAAAAAAAAPEEASAVPPPPPPLFPRPPPPQQQQPNERRRAERLEPLDELEEWELFGRHYCVALGVREPQSAAVKGGGGQAPPLLWAALRAALRPRG